MNERRGESNTKIDIEKITSLEPGKIYAVEISKNHDGLLAMTQIKKASDNLGVKFLVILGSSMKFTEVPEGMDLLKRIEALEKAVEDHDAYHERVHEDK